MVSNWNVARGRAGVSRTTSPRHWWWWFWWWLLPADRYSLTDKRSCERGLRTLIETQEELRMGCRSGCAAGAQTCQV